MPLDVQDVSSGCSWGSAFAAAATVKLEEVDDEFLNRTQSQAPDAGLSRIREIAKRPGDHPNQEEDPELEGRMVAHPGNESEMVMVLINPRSLVVYSGTNRASTGDLLRVGRAKNNSTTIEWEQGAHGRFFAFCCLHHFFCVACIEADVPGFSTGTDRSIVMPDCKRFEGKG